MRRCDEPALPRMDFETWDDLVELLLGPILVTTTAEQIQQRATDAELMAAAAMRAAAKYRHAHNAPTE